MLAVRRPPDGKRWAVLATPAPVQPPAHMTLSGRSLMRKIVFIGAGSLTFTRNLVRDLLTFPALADSRIALVDIDADRLAFAHAAVDHIIRAGRYPARVEAYTERSAALPGADGVVSTILVGGLDVWRTDLEIPKRYRVDINVGHTRVPTANFR